MYLAAEKMMRSNLGLIHFIGIGGIGMSGIAEILLNLGYSVQGSDAKESYVTDRLEKIGIKVFKGHSKDNVKEAKLIVKSSAIGESNPEIMEGIHQGIPIISRADILAEIMRLKISIAISGTHGKTTTTSLTGAMLETAGLNPTVINGGIINHKSTNAYLGYGDFLIAEADESDGTFIKLPSSIAVITNIDPEHLDFYGTFDRVKEAYYRMIENLPFYGFAVLCIDHPEVEALMSRITDRKIFSYGIDSQSVDVKAINIRQKENHFLYDVAISEKLNYSSNIIRDVYLPLMGKHNVLNSLAAITIAIQLKIDADVIKDGFKSFAGVKRRFTETGNVNGIKIIDDYAHHPAEIKATINTARSVSSGKVIAIFQPHRYSRLQSLFADFTHAFEEADILIITEMYAAGEDEIEGINDKTLTAAIGAVRTAPIVYNYKLNEDLVNKITDLAGEGDVLLFMGAGNITYFANQFPIKFAEALKAK